MLGIKNAPEPIVLVVFNKHHTDRHQHQHTHHCKAKSFVDYQGVPKDLYFHTQKKTHSASVTKKGREDISDGVREKVSYRDAAAS